MATRKSWRRAVAPHSPHQRNQSYGNRRASNPNTSSTSTVTSGPFVGISDDALATILAVLLGKPVTLTAIDGSVYDGHFSATERSSPKQPLNIVLRYASIMKPSPKQSASIATIVDLRGSVANRILVPVTSVSVLRAAPPDFNSPNTHSRNTESATRKTSFATDTEISRGAAGVGRPLQRFDQFSESQPVSHATSGSNPASLDEQTFGDLANSQRSTNDWDQFKVNKDKFGVTTTFDENEYTTEIDRKGPDYEQRERQAALIASEIESSTSDNIHIREERNQAIADDYDEEDRFSGVQRNAQQKLIDQPRATAEVPIRPNRPLSYAAAAAAANSRAPAPKAPVQSRQHSQKPAPQSHTNKTHHNKTNTAPRASNHQSKAPHQAAHQTQGSHSTSTRASSNPSHHKNAPGQGKSNNGDKLLPSEKTLQSTKTHMNGKSAQASKDKPGGKMESSSSINSLTPPTGSTVVTTTVSTGEDSDMSKSNSALQKTSPKVGVPNPSESVDSKDEISTAKLKNGKNTAQKDSSSQGILSVPIAKSRSSISDILSPAQSRNSPGSAGTSTIGVLNLDAQPNLGPEKIQEFNRYRMGRASQAIKQNRAQITHGLKEFSSKLDSKSGPSRRGSRSGGAMSSGNLDSPSVSSSSMSSNAQERKLKTDITEDGSTNLSSTEKYVDVKVDVPKDGSAVTDRFEESEEVPVLSDGDSKPTVTDANAEVKSKPKVKSKLNPKAAEFRPTSIRNPTPPVTPIQHGYPMQYGPGMEFSRAMQGIPSGYTMPMQPMPQFPYGQAYTMMMPTPMPSTLPGAGGFQYVPNPGGMSIPMGQVPGRFQQNVATPVSYGYGPPAPMVLAEPPQRMSSASPFPQFYNGPPFPGPQGGGPPMSPSMQQAMFAKVGSAQHGGGPHGQHGQHAGPHGGLHGGGMHMHGGGMNMGGRGNGHGGTNGRRGGMGRTRGRHHGNHHVQHGGHQNGHMNSTHVGANSGGDKIAPHSSGAGGPGSGAGGVAVGSGGLSSSSGLQGSLSDVVPGGSIGATSNPANGSLG